MEQQHGNGQLGTTPPPSTEAFQDWLTLYLPTSTHLCQAASALCALQRLTVPRGSRPTRCAPRCRRYLRCSQSQPHQLGCCLAYHRPRSHAARLLFSWRSMLAQRTCLKAVSMLWKQGVHGCWLSLPTSIGPSRWARHVHRESPSARPRRRSNRRLGTYREAQAFTLRTRHQMGVHYHLAPLTSHCATFGASWKSCANF